MNHKIIGFFKFSQNTKFSRIKSSLFLMIFQIKMLNIQFRHDLNFEPQETYLIRPKSLKFHNIT